MTTVADGLYQFGGMPVTPGVPVPFTGKYFFVDPVNGTDGNDGRSPGRAFATLYAAINAATSGNNDVVVLIGNGAASGSARLSAANANAVDSTATTGTLNWNKNAVHLIGIGAPNHTSQRARIATPTGTYTQTTFGSGNVVVVTGSGCYFSNFSLFVQFSTGGAAQIAWTDNGSRNCYNNVSLLGQVDVYSATHTDSRTLKIGSAGSGENAFYNCTIGADTQPTAKSVANATLELAGGTPRNRFVECIFPFFTSNAGVLGILGTGNACVDRWNSFERCLFLNNIKSTSTTMTALASFTTAAPGGFLLFKDCDSVGMTKLGDTNALANSYVSNLYGTGTSALDVNPS